MDLVFAVVFGVVAVAVSVKLSEATSTAYFEVGVVTAGEVDTGCLSLILQLIDSNGKFQL
tara:strand:- start:104 stop:283 length:180 start_codon:yes stop_codon:yes gene_type:complete